jgi:hypothetical protein
MPVGVEQLMRSLRESLIDEVTGQQARTEIPKAHISPAKRTRQSVTQLARPLCIWDEIARAAPNILAASSIDCTLAYRFPEMWVGG